MNIYHQNSELIRFQNLPSLWLRWGTLIIIGFTILLFLLAQLISYPDLVTGRIEVMGNEPVVHLSMEKAGRVAMIFAEQDNQVEKGEVLLVLENSANLEDIQEVKNWLNMDFHNSFANINDLTIEGPLLRLGDVQPYYQNYRNQLFQQQLWDSLLPKKVYDSLTVNRYEELSNWLEDSKKLLVELNREVVLGKKELKRFSTLRDKGVVTTSEYEAQQRAQSNRKQERSRLQQQISETKLMISSQEDLRQQQGLDLAMDRGLLLDRLQNARMELMKAIVEYERNYLISAPINGNVNWLVPVRPQRHVQTGEPLVAIVPDGSKTAIGIMEATANNKGKLKEGQSCLVHLDNYPRSEYGDLKGTVVSINQVPHPEKKTYAISLAFTSLTTTHGHELPLEEVYLGKAQIVTEKMNLWQRLFRSIREEIAR
ncbi:MAG: HlyD family efflux transporter periplasmic adaptor subunit [Bacteroidota bacterium]